MTMTAARILNILSAGKYVLPQQNQMAAQTRANLRKQNIRDACNKTLRWSLHLSEDEYDSLVYLNPDTLGNPDQQLNDKAWDDFINHPVSSVFKV